MRSRWLIFNVAAAFVGCCVKPSPPAATAPIASAVPIGLWTGVASDHMAGPFLTGPGVYVDFPEGRWPAAASGKRLTVTGVAEVRHDLPVFIQKKDDLMVPQGMPMPDGTDLHAASERIVVLQPRWTIVGDGR